MSRFHSYISSALQIIGSYTGEQPFPYHLKQFFAGQKKYGSRDRKAISECCYAWLRTSHLFDKRCNENNMVQAMYLCSLAPSVLLENLAPELNRQVAFTPAEKLKLLQYSTQKLFPFSGELGQVDATAFAFSFLQQPLLYLRLRPGKEKKVLEKLDVAGMDYTLLAPDCIALSNATRLDDILVWNKEAVVQDCNSQQVFGFLQTESIVLPGPRVWDCCAASGGKSILLHDRVNAKLKLTVSDIRPAILHNCKKRLQEAGINIHHAFVADMSKPLQREAVEEYDIIICDAPCTGSGTWSRTPEQLAYFDTEKINSFSILQQSIAGNAAAYLKEGGLLFYITCSVFKKENEDVVAHLKKSYSLLHSQYLYGYAKKADTMFVAVFQK